MEQVLDFIRAAAPWVAMGLLLAIFAVRNAVSKKKGKKAGDNYGTEGMCFGMALGSALGNNTGIGLSLGMLVGLAAGMCIPKSRKIQINDNKSYRTDDHYLRQLLWLNRTLRKEICGIHLSSGFVLP